MKVKGWKVVVKAVVEEAFLDLGLNLNLYSSLLMMVYLTTFTYYF
jgi:hypothetical protein